MRRTTTDCIEETNVGTTQKWALKSNSELPPNNQSTNTANGTGPKHHTTQQTFNGIPTKKSRLSLSLSFPNILN